MTTRKLALLCLGLSLLSFGCRKVDPLGPSDPPPGDDDDVIPIGKLFSLPIWAEFGRFSPNQVAPDWDIELSDEDDDEVDEPKPHSSPSQGSRVPRDADDIRYRAQAKAVLTDAHLDELVGAFNSGLPTAEGDLVLFPTVSRFMPAGEEYVFFHINVQSLVEAIPTRDDEPRTRVVGLAFGNGSGGYIAQSPNTDDPFAGALVWMKATRNPIYNRWGMDQRDWRSGVGSVYGTSLRFVIRGDAVVAVILRSELEELGVTRFRWDMFSYTTNPTTDWSHDFTDWAPID